MKRIISTLIVVVGVILFGNNTLYAQSGDLKLGGGLVLSTGAVDNGGDLDNTIGLKVDGVYEIDENWRAGGDFTFYFPDEEGNTDLTVWELNFNAHYIFYQENDLMAYGIGGLNITSINIDTQFGDNSESEFGLNLGGGIEYPLDFANLFGELKFGGIGGDADQFVFGAGLRFPV